MTGRHPETGFIRSYMESQREQLEGQLVGEEAARYAAGSIESPTVFSEDIDWFFAGSEPAAWFQRLGSALLSWAYPLLPLESSLMPRPVTPEEVPRIYEAIFASSAEAKAPLIEFGPGLGLSKPQAPSEFDPEGCQVFRQIQIELESSQGEVLWEHILLQLSHAYGLTRPLATLYLMAFAYGGQPDIELGLAPRHTLNLREGQVVRGRRLTRELIPLLSWRSDLFSRRIVSLRFPKLEISWNDTLQYLSFLCQGLQETEEDSPDISIQERPLLDALSTLSRDTDRAGEVLETLGRTVPSPNCEELIAVLRNLSEVCAGGNFRRVYELCRGAYGDPQELLRCMDLLRRVLELGESQTDIVDMKTYLNDATVQGGHDQLSLDRRALLEEMSLAALLGGVHGWAAVRGQIRQYQDRYRRAYISHHDDYQRDASRIWVSLEDSRLKLHALSLLNSIVELGDPVGAALVERYIGLEHDTRRCGVNPREFPLHTDPRCAECQIALGDMPPGQELELFLRDLDRALAEQNRRLSLVLVERILEDRVDQRIEYFLKIVQASDLSALSHTLDAELALFIRELLRNP